MPIASSPAGVMRSRTARPSASLRQIVLSALSARVWQVGDLLAREAAGEKRADHLGRGAAAQRAGQRQQVAVGALRGGREDDRLGIGELGHRDRPFGCEGRDHPDPATTPSRAPEGARRSWRRAGGSGLHLVEDLEVGDPAGQVGKAPRDALVAGGPAVDPPAHPAGDRRRRSRRRAARAVQRPFATSSAKWRPWRESRKSRTPSGEASVASAMRREAISQASVGSAAGLVSMRGWCRRSPRLRCGSAGSWWSSSSPVASA